MPTLYIGPGVLDTLGFVNQDTQAPAVGPLADPGLLPEAEPGTMLGTAPDAEAARDVEHLGPPALAVLGPAG